METPKPRTRVMERSRSIDGSAPGAKASGGTRPTRISICDAVVLRESEAGRRRQGSVETFQRRRRGNRHGHLVRRWLRDCNRSRHESTARGEERWRVRRAAAGEPRDVVRLRARMMMVFVTCRHRRRGLRLMMHRTVWCREAVVRVRRVRARNEGPCGRERELNGHRHQSGNCQEPARGNHRIDQSIIRVSAAPAASPPARP